MKSNACMCFLTNLYAKKQLKNWKQEWKNKLINDHNSERKDSSNEIRITNKIIETVKNIIGRLRVEPAMTLSANNGKN